MAVQPPYYTSEYGDRLKEPIKEMFRKWSGVTGEELDQRLYQIRDRAWTLAPYPCIGLWIFLMPSITAFTRYPEIVAASLRGTPILDLGCCFGQHLRMLAADGVPTDNMCASDIQPKLWELGFDLFGDRQHMRAKFLQADIFEPVSSLDAWDNTFGIIIASQVLHLWDWNRQLIAMKRIVRLSKPGTMVVGYQRGREQAMIHPQPWGEMFIHDLKTFHEIWEQLAAETGTRWALDVALVTLDEWGMEPEDTAWMDQPPRGLNFIITRTA